MRAIQLRRFFFLGLTGAFLCVANFESPAQPIGTSARTEIGNTLTSKNLLIPQREPNPLPLVTGQRLPPSVLGSPPTAMDGVNSAVASRRILGTAACVVESDGLDLVIEPCSLMLVGTESSFQIYTLLEISCSGVDDLPADACYQGSVVLSRIDGAFNVTASEFEIEAATEYAVFVLDSALRLADRGSIETNWFLIPQKERYVASVKAFDAAGNLVAEESWAGSSKERRNPADREAASGQLAPHENLGSIASPQPDPKPAPPPPEPEPTGDAAGPSCAEYADLAKSEAALITATAEVVLELLGFTSTGGEELIAELELDAEVLERLEATMGEDMGSKAEGIGVAAKLTEGLIEQLGAQGGARLIRKISSMYDMRGRIDNFSDAFANYTWQQVNVACKEAQAAEAAKGEGQDEGDGDEPPSGGPPKTEPETPESCLHCSDCREKYTEKTRRDTSGGVEEIEVVSTRSCVCAAWVTLYGENCRSCDSPDECIY